MEEGRFRRKDGGCRMEDGGWRMEEGGRMEDVGLRMVSQASCLSQGPPFSGRCMERAGWRKSLFFLGIK